MCARPSAPPPSRATPIFARDFCAGAFSGLACGACARVEFATANAETTKKSRNRLIDSLPRIQTSASVLRAQKFYCACAMGELPKIRLLLLAKIMADWPTLEMFSPNRFEQLLEMSRRFDCSFVSGDFEQLRIELHERMLDGGMLVVAVPAVILAWLRRFRGRVFCIETKIGPFVCKSLFVFHFHVQAH